MQGQPSISKVLEGPGAEARAARLRRRFRAAAPGGRRRGLGRVGRGLLVLYWAGCLAVILAGLDRMYPGLRAQMLPTPLAPTQVAVRRPFASCDAAHAAGVYNIPAGSPGYKPGQDGDGDGFACEPAPR
jgi:hypothetical protein